MDNKGLSGQVPLFGEGSIKNRIILVVVIFWVSAMFALYSDYNMATGTGNLSTLLFLIGNVYYPARHIRLKYNPEKVQALFNKFLVYHIWLNTASFGVACAHCYVTLWSNNWLLLALFLMGWLTLGGFLMWIKYPPAKLKAGLYILHTQQFVFFLMIFAMLKGHYVI